MEHRKPENVVPQPFDKLFTSYDCFNEMQYAMLDDLLKTDKSLVLSAPTGSGKTVAFELAIVRMLQNNKLQQDCCYNKILPKAIYIAPIKALCNEKFNDWKPRFESIGVKCVQLTGDTESSNFAAIFQAQVVISTPEKWDSLTRRWRDFQQILPAVQLFIADEVHLLNTDMRGPVLEAVVARMKSNGVKRFVVASATIPNVEDLSTWLRGESSQVQVAQHVFNEMQRPVPLEKHVIGFSSKLRGFQFDMRLNFQLPDILRKYAEDKASLVFCNSRKSAEMAAFNLNKTPTVFTLSQNQKLYLGQLAPSISDTKLRKLVENGIAYHHAGLQYTDRDLIESSFRQGFLMVLISTSTLAMGVNLPARLVVIKSTETYNSGGFSEYPENMILQMIGRAGRPQYDTKGVAVIMTQQKNVLKYEKILNGTAPIESHLHKHLTEHLNAEVSLNTITSLEMAMVWIRSTYLYIRAVRNPKHYGFDAKLSKDFVEQKLEELCLRQINALQGTGLVKFDPFTGTDVKITIYGQLMTKYYLCFETIKLFQQLNGKESMDDLLKLLVRCKEMSEFTLRVSEKKVLNELNKTPIRFPIKGRVKNNEEKISCIIQAILGNIEISAPGLIQESLKIMRIADRVSKCLLEYVRLRVKETTEKHKVSNNWYSAMLNAVTIAKCLHVKLWEDSEFSTKQLHGIGTVYSNALAKLGINSLKSIAKTEARTIEKVLNKSAPFGDQVLRHLMTFPEYEIKLERRGDDFVKIIVNQVNEEYVHKGGHSAVFILGDTLNNLLLLEENLNNIIEEYGTYERLVQLQEEGEVDYVYGHVVHVSLVGVDAYATLIINAIEKKVKTDNGSGDKQKKSRKKQSRLNFSLSDSFFDKTTLSDENLNFGDIFGDKSTKDKTGTTAKNNAHQNNSGKLSYAATIAQEPRSINAMLKENVERNHNESQIFENTLELGKSVVCDLEKFCLNKPKMRSSDSNSDFHKETLEKILAEEANDETLNDVTFKDDFNTTSKTNSTKQSKLTDFFSQRRKVGQKSRLMFDESIDLTKNQKNFDEQLPKKSFKMHPLQVNQQNADNKQEQETTPRSSRIQSSLPRVIEEAETYANSSLQDGCSVFTPTSCNRKKNSKESGNSSSDEIPLTMIPNPKKFKFSNTHLNDSSFSEEHTKCQFVTNRGPMTLASFLCDPDELNKSVRMIKLPTEPILKTKTLSNSFFEEENEFEKSVPLPLNFTKPQSFNNNFLKENNSSTAFNKKYNSNDSLAKTFMRGFKETPFDTCHIVAPLEFKKPKAKHFDFSPDIFDTSMPKKTETLLELLDFSQTDPNKSVHPNSFIKTKENKNEGFLDFMSKQNQATFKITAKFEPKNESAKPTYFFEKRCLNESLINSTLSDSPETQCSPLDLSKTEDVKMKPNEGNKSTQTNFEREFTENQKERPNDEDFKFWHKVALHFRKVPSMQAQSLTNFQAVYSVVRQRQHWQQKLQQDQQKKTPMAYCNPHTSSSSKTNQNLTQRFTLNKNGDKNGTLANFKVNQHSTFRLQLFDDDDKKPKEYAKLNRREIKLINQNIMNFVLEKKCKENAQAPERDIEVMDYEEEMDKLARELGIHNNNDLD